jgi:hypothetical protein
MPSSEALSGSAGKNQILAFDNRSFEAVIIECYRRLEDGFLVLGSAAIVGRRFDDATVLRLAYAYGEREQRDPYALPSGRWLRPRPNGSNRDTRADPCRRDQFRLWSGSAVQNQ